MSIRSELLALQTAAKDKVLHVETAVQWAADHPNSALHQAIEWDDEKAAHEHRLWQVRQLIRLHVVAEDDTPLLVSLSFDRAQGGGYRALNDVVKMPDLREILLRDALEELDRVRKKYERIAALAQVWEAADAVRSRSGRRRAPTQPAART